MAVNITVENVSQTSIYVKAQSNYYNDKTFEWYLDNVWKATETGTNNGSGYYYDYYTFTGLSAGRTYKISVKVKNNNGVVVEEDYVYATTQSASPPSSPSSANFEWDTPKTSGVSFNITATEWNRFLDAINSARAGKGLTAYNFTYATQGSDFYAYMFNQAVQAISAMNPPISPPNTRSSGDEIYASYLNRLRDSLNSIQ